MKSKQLRPGFELTSSFPFRLTVTQQPPPYKSSLHFIANSSFYVEFYLTADFCFTEIMVE